MSTFTMAVSSVTVTWITSVCATHSQKLTKSESCWSEFAAKYSAIAWQPVLAPARVCRDQEDKVGKLIKLCKTFKN